MWILPRNHSMSYLCVRDTAVSISDWEKLLKSCPADDKGRPLSLMWRSKASPLQTWLTRWKRAPWIRYLSGRILRPSRREYFEAQLIASLQGTRASLSPVPGNDKVMETRDTYGLTFEKQYERSAPNGFFSKMLRDTYQKGSYKSSPIWKKWRTRLGAEYSARRKSAHLTDGNGCLSWPTVSVPNGGRSPTQGSVSPTGMTPDGKKRRVDLQYAVRNWQTPEAANSTGYQNQKDGSRIERLGTQVKNWGTPRVTTNGGSPSSQCTGRGSRLEDQVVQNWPTPNVGEANSPCETSQKNLTTAVRSWPSPAARDYKAPNLKAFKDQGGGSGGEQLPNFIAHYGRPDPVNPNTTGSNPESWPTPRTPTGGPEKRADKAVRGSGEECLQTKANGKLNSDWVESLMGLPTGWTDLDF